MAKCSRVFVVEGNPDDVFLACQRTVKDMDLAVKSMTGDTMVLRQAMGLTKNSVTLDVNIRGLEDGSSDLKLDGSTVFQANTPWTRRVIEETMTKFANGVSVELQQADSRPASSTPEPPPAEPEFSVADELEKLADLRDRGVLSNEEFAAQKSKLLAG
jgi:hypothetical protein